MLARATTEKASLISCRSMSLAATPAFSRARGTARAGEVVKSTGACSASAKPRMTASGYGEGCFGKVHKCRRRKKQVRGKNSEEGKERRQQTQ